MKKISITAQLAAYTVSMLMGFGTFAAWNYVSIPQEIQMNEIPVINLASLGISTLPMVFIFFLPSFCLSRSFLFLVISPP